MSNAPRFFASPSLAAYYAEVIESAGRIAADPTEREDMRIAAAATVDFYAEQLERVAA